MRRAIGLLLLSLSPTAFAASDQPGTSSDRTAITAAARKGDAERVKALLVDGGPRIIIEADDLLETLLEKGLDDVAELWWQELTRVEQDPRETGLAGGILAGDAQRGHLRSVKFLLGKGVPIDSDKYNIGTPLMCAIRMGQREVATLLVERGADVEATDAGGQTILTAAVFSRDPVVLAAVLRAHPKLNRVDGSGDTALGVAARFGTPEIVEMLLRQPGIDVNAPGHDGLTPLMRAAELGQDANVAVLLKAGARRDAKTPDGRTAETIAREARQPGVLRILRGDAELGSRMEAAAEEAPTTEEIERVRAILEAWVVRQDTAAVEAALDRTFDSSLMHAEDSRFPPSIRKLGAAARVIRFLLASEVGCVTKCDTLAACIGTGKQPFDATARTVGSEDAHFGPNIERALGEKLLWVETVFGRCGLGVVMVLTRDGSKSRIVMLEYVPVG